MNSIFREQATTRLRPDDLLTKVPGGGSQTISAEFWEAPSGGSITAAIAESQSAQTESIVAAEKYSATIIESQAAQTESIVATEKYSATIAESQAAQSEAISATETYSATLSETQAAQTEAINGTVGDIITVAIVEGQASQVDAIVCYLPVAPPSPVAPSGGGGGWGGKTYIRIHAPKKRKQEEKPPEAILPVVENPKPRVIVFNPRSKPAEELPWNSDSLDAIVREIREKSEQTKQVALDLAIKKAEQNEEAVALLLLV